MQSTSPHLPAAAPLMSSLPVPSPSLPVPSPSLPAVSGFSEGSPQAIVAALCEKYGVVEQAVEGGAPAPRSANVSKVSAADAADDAAVVAALCAKYVGVDGRAKGPPDVAATDGSPPAIAPSPPAWGLGGGGGSHTPAASPTAAYAAAAAAAGAGAPLDVDVESGGRWAHRPQWTAEGAHDAITPSTVDGPAPPLHGTRPPPTDRGAAGGSFVTFTPAHRYLHTAEADVPTSVTTCPPPSAPALSARSRGKSAPWGGGDELQKRGGMSAALARARRARTPSSGRGSEVGVAVAEERPLPMPLPRPPVTTFFL